jgi:hypothetical protein
VTARETVLRARKALLNGSGEISYFEDRGIAAKIVEGAWVGYMADVAFRDYKGPAFIYPCIAKGGGLLAVHYKSKARNDDNKRWQKWGDYADDLPPKGHGKKPDDPAKVIPFGMETLEGLEPGAQVILFCGEEDALSARQAGHTSVSQAGAGLLEPAYAREFAGFEVVVFYDAGEEKEARKDALTLMEAGAATARVVEWAADAPHGTDVNGRLVEDPEGFEEWLCGVIEGAKPLASDLTAKRTHRGGEPDSYGAEDEAASEDEAEERKPTQAELLVRCASGADLFHTPAGDSYVTVPVRGHRETHPMKAKGFRRWLVRAYYERYGRPPTNQALQDALTLLEARALFDGSEREVYVRVAGHAGNIYIDLVNEGWEVVEITPAGWRVVSGEDTPVRFRRPRGMLALPTPLPVGDGDDGCDDLLRRFFNVSDEKELRLIVAWLVAALRPVGPYPALLFQGEQGSAKSTAERFARAVVDPSAAPLRTTPRNEHDLYIAADNAHVIALDNISTLQPWLSDALCRLSTGGGFSTRTLYENREVELFEGMKPVILNGITDVATRPDLLDRALIVSLPPIPDEERRAEAELWEEFEQLRPTILASLFDAVSGALRSVEDVRLEGMPRMADFALWATAAEEFLGWDTGTFMTAYSGNRQEATDSALDADPVAAAVLDFMADRDHWAGSASELWTALGELVYEGVRKTKAWPGAPNALTGRLRRLAPTLRGVGIEYGEYRSGRSREKVLTKNKPARDRHDRHQRHDEEFSAKESQMRGDDPGDDLSVGDDVERHNDDPAQETVTQQSLIDKGNAGGGDGRDGDDGDMQAESKAPLRDGRPLSEALEPGQSATLPELAAWKRVEAAGAQMRCAKSGPALALKTYLEKPSAQRLEWLTKAVLRVLDEDTGGWEAHVAAVKAAAEDPKNHPLGCECEVCL